jgi:hypothetical protein
VRHRPKSLAFIRRSSTNTFKDLGRLDALIVGAVVDGDEIHAPTLEGGNTPVIPAPGSPGGNPNVIPK